ncbi:MAG: prolyl oligopeptidase family serine peptidase [Bifidobacteriaceae bacterium]|jgi:oligopeptidase B|nr:prolyl oligopeptidase family serine peptidase [Bifidobacteriaceae bacterium]
MLQRFDFAAQTIPMVERSGRWWYRRIAPTPTSRGAIVRLPVHDSDNWVSLPQCAIDARQANAETLVDHDDLALRHSFYQFGSLAPHRSLPRYAFTADLHGQGRFTALVYDRSSCSDEIDRIETASAQVCLSVTGRSLFYLRPDSSGRPHEVVRHDIGQDTNSDEVVYREPTRSGWLSIGATRSSGQMRIGRFGVSDSSSFSYPLLDRHAGVPIRVPGPFSATKRFEHAIHGRTEYLVLVRLNGSTGARVVFLTDEGGGWGTSGTVNLSAPKGYILGDRALTGSQVAFVARSETNQAVLVSRLPLSSGHEREQPLRFAACLPLAGDVVIREPADWNAPETGFIWSSLDMPPTQHTIVRSDNCQEVEAMSGDCSLAPPFGIGQTSNVKEVTCQARDGTPIPVTLIRPLDQVSGKARPGKLVLHAYGCYGQPLPRGFVPDFRVLLERGVGVALAHVRGGGGYGLAWQRAGQGRNKMRSIQDYVDVAGHLAENAAAGNGGIVGLGASAGGMVVAAAANQSPHLFSGIALVAPFISPLRAIANAADPRSGIDRAEFAGMSDLASDIDAVRSFSPLENLRRGMHPPVYVAVNSHDSKVSNRDIIEWVSRLTALGVPVTLEERPNSSHEGTGGADIPARAHLIDWVARNLGA